MRPCPLVAVLVYFVAILVLRPLLPPGLVPRHRRPILLRLEFRDGSARGRRGLTCPAPSQGRPQRGVRPGRRVCSPGEGRSHRRDPRAARKAVRQEANGKQVNLVRAPSAPLRPKPLASQPGPRPRGPGSRATPVATEPRPRHSPARGPRPRPPCPRPDREAFRPTRRGPPAVCARRARRLSIDLCAVRAAQARPRGSTQPAARPSRPGAPLPGPEPARDRASPGHVHPPTRTEQPGARASPGRAPAFPSETPRN